MSIDLDVLKLSVFIGGMALFLLIERALPRRAWQLARHKRFGFHVAIAALNTVLIRFTVYVPFLLWAAHVAEQGWGISRWLGLAGWMELVASIVVLDFFNYLWHRANHRVSLLWRFHKAHHSDTEMDLTTALRFHPGELMISAFAKAGWIALWGPSVIAWFVFEALVSLAAQFHHSNIDFPDRIENRLSRLIVTPRYHAAHHAVDRDYGDRNFCTILSLWDYLLGTYSRPADGGATTVAPGSIGLPEARDKAFSFGEWLMDPFRRRNVGLAWTRQDASRPPANE